MLWLSGCFSLIYFLVVFVGVVVSFSNSFFLEKIIILFVGKWEDWGGRS